MAKKCTCKRRRTKPCEEHRPGFHEARIEKLRDDFDKQMRLLRSIAGMRF